MAELRDFFARHHLSRRDRDVVSILWIILLLNALVALVKIIVGGLTNRITVVGDGLHSLLDGANNVVGIVAITLSARPADKEHPYGHRKFENIAAMMIGGLIVLVSYELFTSIMHSFVEQFRGNAPAKKLEPADPLLIVLVASTLIVNVCVAVYETSKGRKLQSPFLLADSKHTLADTFVTGFSIASLLVARHAWWIDPVLALGVLAFLVHAAWTIIRTNLAAFTDRQFLDPSEVQRVVNQVEGVEASTRIRSHGTENDVHLDLRITVNEELSAREVEEIESAVRRQLREKFSNLSLIGIQHETADEQSKN